MTWTFTPSKQQANAQVPFFENATGQTAPNYASKRTISEATKLVSDGIARLGATVTSFTAGKYTIHNLERYGYEIAFLHGGVQGVIRVAGLPIRDYAPYKERQVKVQALLTIADWLKSAYTARIFNPDMNPLLPFLLLPDGKTTVAEYIQTQGLLPPPRG